ncbi:MAG: hypothetical protein ACRYFW_02845 [Janthinobacterium lividum]
MPDPAAPAATVAHALLGSLAHHFLTALGTAVVTRGIVDQRTVTAPCQWRSRSSWVR